MRALSGARGNMESASGKIEFLERELGEAVDLMRSIKHAFDPENIMKSRKAVQDR